MKRPARTKRRRRRQQRASLDHVKREQFEQQIDTVPRCVHPEFEGNIGKPATESSGDLTSETMARGGGGRAAVSVPSA
jgi:hypothetical protein